MYTETQEKRINETLANGDTSQLKWNELLTEFTNQSMDRMAAAMSLMTPSALDSIIEIATNAKDKAKVRHFELLRAKLANEGVDMDEFYSYLKDRPAPARNESPNRLLTKEQRDAAHMLIEQKFAEGETSPKKVTELLHGQGLKMSYASVSSKMVKLKKKKEAENKNQLEAA